MLLIERIPFRAERPARRSRRRRTAKRAPAAPSPSAADGPPQDRATYNCSCGFVFEADVTTSIRCPHCCGELAW